MSRKCLENATSSRTPEVPTIACVRSTAFADSKIAFVEAPLVNEAQRRPPLRYNPSPESRGVHAVRCCGFLGHHARRAIITTDIPEPCRAAAARRHGDGQIRCADQRSPRG